MSRTRKCLERWLPIPSWEGVYQVSSTGRVRSLDRIDANGHRRKGKILKQSVSSSGYYQVRLSFGKRIEVSFPHQLVLQSFVSMRPDGMEACHEDDDKLNNHLGNLRWGTKLSNVTDAIRNGRVRPRIKVIRSDGIVFDSIHQAASKTPGASSGRISEIVRGIRVGNGVSGGYGWSLKGR
jgi:hypothetical protein